MWIKLDFTPLFVNGLIVGLVLVVIGLFLRKGFPNRPALGIVVIVIGAIPALLCGLFLLPGRFESRSVMEKLPADREILGTVWPRDSTIIWIGREMYSAIVSQPVPVSGIPMEGQLIFGDTPDKKAVYLRTATLSEDRVIDGVPCKAGHSLEFFPAEAPRPIKGQQAKVALGRLKQCNSSADFERAGNRYQADAMVTLDPSGGVEESVLAADQDVDGHWCQKGAKVKWTGRRATQFTLARDEMIGGVACKGHTEVELAPEDGHVISAVLAQDQELNAMPCRGGEPVEFDYSDPAHPLTGCVVSRPVTEVGIVWPAGSNIRGFMTDWLEVSLPPGAEDVQVGEVKIVGRCKVTFDKKAAELTGVDVLAGEAGYAEIHGGRFERVQIRSGLAYAHLLEAATVDGVAHEAGASVELKLGPAR